MVLFFDWFVNSGYKNPARRPDRYDCVVLNRCGADKQNHIRRKRKTALYPSSSGRKPGVLRNVRMRCCLSFHSCSCGKYMHFRKVGAFSANFLIFFSFCKRKGCASVRIRGPDTGQVYNGLHGSLHRVDRTVLEFAVKFMPPVNRFGHGRPMYDSLAPSVPPRIGRTIGATPACRIASIAFSITSGYGSIFSRML